MSPLRSTTSLAFRASIFGVFLVATLVGCSTKKIINQTGGGGPGGAEADPREVEACSKAGGTMLPINVYDITPDEASGTACDVANALDDDGSMAALDWPGPGKHTLAGREVGGCLAVEFRDGDTLQSLSMKMRPVGAGCGHACTAGENGCGTGWKVSIFAGPSISKLDFVQELTLTKKELSEYRVVVYERFQAKFAAICREATAETGDDIGIDAVYGFCK